MDEIALARVSTLPDYDSFRLLKESPPERAMSIRADRAILTACDDALGGRLGSVLPSEALTEVASKCTDIGRQISQAAPTWAFPAFVSAVSAYHLGDRETAFADLRQSRRFGPYESWLAERRVGFALQLLEEAPDFAREALNADIAALLESRLGRIYVASIYVRSPDVRPLILAQLESLEPDLKREFLFRARQAANPLDMRNE